MFILLLLYHSLEVCDFDAGLRGGVAVADSDGVVLESIEIDDDTFRGADFVLFSVTLTDVAGIVPSDIAVLGFELIEDLLGFIDELGFVLEEWRNAEFVGSEVFGEFENGAGFVFTFDFFFGVGFGQDGEEETLDADRRLDDVWNESTAGVFVTVEHGFARFAFDVLEVEVGAVGETHKFFLTVWVVEHEVNGAFRIVGAVFGWDFVFVDFVGTETEDVFEEIVLSFSH